MMPPIIVLTLSNITQKIRETFATFVDPRDGKNKKYSMTDAALSAFSVFFMQSPSFLEYQRTLQQSENCSTKKHSNGTITYHHSAVTPVLIKSKCNKVILLFPEFIQPQDGAEKQDCEINASKRWLKKNGEKFAKLKSILLGDDLNCHEPFCRNILEIGLEFIFTCKQSSHTITQERLDFLQNNDCIRTIIHSRYHY